MIDKIIKIDDLEGRVYELENWKPSNSIQVKQYFTEKALELKNEYNKLLHEFNINKIIFDCEINFKPVMGKNYFLYQNENGKKFMSLISPSEWKNQKSFSYLGCFKQDSVQKWIEVNN
tara:strand:- start:576 stop:929 length:354 start_codon:yes stop_codon:yes gene_type:complete